jgi:hypothetical protein
VAALTSLRTSVISGGLLCIGFVALTAALIPSFRRYDVRTNEFVIEEAKNRKNIEKN